MRSQGLTSVDSEFAFNPLNIITNEEAAQLVNMYASGVLRLSNINNLCNFDNIDQAQTGYRNHINELCQKGLTRYINGSFNMTGSYTKASLIVALVKGIGGYQFDHSDYISPWYQNYCTYAQQNGLTRESDCSSLDRPMTRYEVALMLYRGAQGNIYSGFTHRFGGTAYFEHNNDRAYNSGSENTVDGMNVYLYRCGSPNDGHAIASTQTDYYGGYQFDNLLPGSYRVSAGGIPNFESISSSYNGYDSWCYDIGNQQAEAIYDIPLVDTYPRLLSYNTGLQTWSQGDYVLTHKFSLHNSGGSILNSLKSFNVGINQLIGSTQFSLRDMIGSVKIRNISTNTTIIVSGSQLGSGGYSDRNEWSNIDDPTGSGDFEYIDTSDFDTEGNHYTYGSCGLHVGSVQIVTADTNQTAQEIGQKVRYIESPKGKGYQCLNSENPGGCRDYKIRFHCNYSSLDVPVNLLISTGSNNIEVSIQFTNGYPQSQQPYDMALNIGSMLFSSSINSGIFIEYNPIIDRDTGSIDPYVETSENHTAGTNNLIGYKLKYQANSAQGIVAGKTWFDQNGDGVLQTGENTVDGMNIGLYHCMLSGSMYQATNYFVSQTITDYYGGYQFSGLIPGWYQVRVGGLKGFTNLTPQSTCMYVSRTGSSIFNSYLVVPPVVVQAAGSSPSSSSPSSNSVGPTRTNPFTKVTTVNTTSSATNSTTPTVVKTPTTQNTSTTTATTPKPVVKQISITSKDSVSKTDPTTKNTTSEVSSDTAPKKHVVTIKINDDGSIAIVPVSDTKANTDNKDTPQQSDKKTPPVAYLAKDLSIQQDISSDSNYHSVAPIEFKPYWVITPEMITNISILQDGYQPTWDATPFKITVRLDPRIKSAWDVIPAISFTESSFYRLVQPMIRMITR